MADVVEGVVEIEIEPRVAKEDECIAAK